MPPDQIQAEADSAREYAKSFREGSGTRKILEHLADILEQIAKNAKHPTPTGTPGTSTKPQSKQWPWERED